MHGTRVDPSILKKGAIITALVITGVGFYLARQPGGVPNVRIQFLTFAAVQLLAELLFLPLTMRSLTKKRPYNGSHMLIQLAFHMYGLLLGFVLTAISHDPRYLYYFGFPCILLMLITPTGKR